MKHLIKIFFSIMLFALSSFTLADGISIENTYVREVPPGQMTSAFFMILKNDSDKNIALIKASSDVAKNVEIHEHIHEDGMMKMRQIEKVILNAKSTTKLKPGGYHIMLIGLTRKIKAGDIIAITLEFDNGDKKEIKVEVKKIMAGMMDAMSSD
ncbi:MAG: copper chaperone PCu(A)C [Cocleimonas sp.]